MSYEVYCNQPRKSGGLYVLSHHQREDEALAAQKRWNEVLIEFWPHMGKAFVRRKEPRVR